MREILVRTPEEYGKVVADAAERNKGTNIVRLKTAGEKAEELIIAYMPNTKVDALLNELQEIPELHLTLKPRGSIILTPPSTEVTGKTVDVEPRSPFEVFLGGLQSVGSWKGFLGYTVTAGVVAWIGLFTNTVYLLVAAMLIAPFAGPAMNSALATARGDRDLLNSSLTRYLVSIVLAIALACVLSLILQQRIATPLMVDVSQISMISVLLPIAAGTAGALNLIQSERSSLVSGAAIGMLIAASLSPAAALTGMGAAIWRMDLALSGLFVLSLQLVCINLAGAAVFRMYGLSTRGTRFERGKKWVSAASLSASIIILAGLLVVQFLISPDLERSSLSQRAAADIQDVIRDSGVARPVEVNVRFTRPSIREQNTLLCVIYVQKSRGDLGSEEIRSDLVLRIQQKLMKKGYNVTPLIDLTVLNAKTG